MKGTLYLIPSPLGDAALDEIIPAGNLRYIQNIRHFIVEDERSARRFLRKAGFNVSFDEVTFFVLDQHTDSKTIPAYIDPLKKGSDTGLISEAGVPAVADPGNVIVAMAHECNIRVKPLTGPSSIILALMSSGMNGQQFHFHGYLPIEAKKRSESIKKIEAETMAAGSTQVFIETPYRNMQMFDEIIRVCHSNTLLGIACDLTGASEFIATMTVENWKKHRPDLHKKPAVFLIYSGHHKNKKY